MRILIIGGTGFIGIHLVNELLRADHEIGVLALPSDDCLSLLPENVTITCQDFKSFSDNQLLDLLKPYDSVVYAAGVDDRFVPTKPAWPFFYTENFVPVFKISKQAGEAGIKRLIIIGSYFTHFDALWPDMNLKNNHPYIFSRVMQTRLGRDIPADGVDISYIGLPFVFGDAVNKKPMWTPLLKYLKSSLPVFAPSGGTAVVAVETVARVVRAALEKSRGVKQYYIGQENLTWKELFKHLASIQGKNRKVFHLPKLIMNFVFSIQKFRQYIRNTEAGLSNSKLADLLTRDLFLDTTKAKDELDYKEYDLSKAFHDTIISANRDIQQTGILSNIQENEN